MAKHTANNLLKLAAPARRALAGANISTLEDLSRKTKSEIAVLHGIGKNALEALQQALAESHLTFAADDEMD